MLISVKCQSAVQCRSAVVDKQTTWWNVKARSQHRSKAHCLAHTRWSSGCVQQQQSKTHAVNRGTVRGIHKQTHGYLSTQHMMNSYVDSWPVITWLSWIRRCVWYSSDGLRRSRCCGRMVQSPACFLIRDDAIWTYSVHKALYRRQQTQVRTTGLHKPITSKMAITEVHNVNTNTNGRGWLRVTGAHNSLDQSSTSFPYHHGIWKISKLGHISLLSPFQTR